MGIQVIRWTIHNPGAPNIRCSVLRVEVGSMEAMHCANNAEWATVEPFPGSRVYRMVAYCAEHWVMRRHEDAE